MRWSCDQRRLTLLLCVAGTLGFLPPAAGQAEQASSALHTSPTIGLALGGGSARGIAHIGFLEWLEEHRIPVHYIAGTSMGGLVGGAYASGMSPAELRQLMRDMDWDIVFLADSPFKYKTFRRKEDARRYPSQIELGLRGGLKLPAGMNSGQEITFALDRIAAPYHEVESFDELPIPFRCVAADLKSQRQVILDSGSLAVAMRATMAIPGVFTPVAVDDLLLVDGGTLNNVPADVTRSMGADAVIAVNVGAATDGAPEPENLFDVLGQSMDMMMAAGVDRAIASADVIVSPDLRGLTGLDFRRSEELADRGYAAAEAMRDALLPYAVDAAAYQAWRHQRESRVRTLPALIADVRLEGIEGELAERMQRRLRSALAGKPFDAETLKHEALLLQGTDRYTLVRYRLEESDQGTNLVIHVEPKGYGPPFLHPAVDLQNIDSDNFSLDLRARLVFFDTFVPESEIRIDGAIGTRMAASAELFRRIGRSRLFVAPRAYASRKNLNAYGNENAFLAQYREVNLGLGMDVGLDLGHLSELRFGYDAADLETNRRIGGALLPEADGVNRFLSLRFTFDGQTSPVIPTRGVYLRSAVRHYFDSPNFRLGELTFEGPKDYQQAEVRVSAFRSFKGNHRLFVGASGGTSLGDDPGYNEFELGGLLRLGAFNEGQLRDDNYLLVEGGALIRVLRLPDVIGGNGYLAGWLEVGSAFEQWEDAKAEWQASGGFVLETFLGPVFVGGSVSFSTGDGRFYLSVGTFLR